MTGQHCLSMPTIPVTLLIGKMKAAHARRHYQGPTTVLMSSDVLERLDVELRPLIAYRLPGLRLAHGAVARVYGLDVHRASGFAILEVK